MIDFVLSINVILFTSVLFGCREMVAKEVETFKNSQLNFFYFVSNGIGSYFVFAS